MCQSMSAYSPRATSPSSGASAGGAMYDLGVYHLVVVLHLLGNPAIERVTADPAMHTRDLGGNATTAELTRAVCERLAGRADA